MIKNLCKNNFVLDHKKVLGNVSSKVRMMNVKTIKETVAEYGNAKTKKVFEPLLS